MGGGEGFGLQGLEVHHVDAGRRRRLAETMAPTWPVVVLLPFAAVKDQGTANSSRYAPMTTVAVPRMSSPAEALGSMVGVVGEQPPARGWGSGEAGSRVSRRVGAHTAGVPHTSRQPPASPPPPPHTWAAVALPELAGQGVASLQRPGAEGIIRGDVHYVGGGDHGQERPQGPCGLGVPGGIAQEAELCRQAKEVPHYGNREAAHG